MYLTSLVHFSLFISAVLPHNVNASENNIWYSSFSLNATQGNYENSNLLDTVTSASIFYDLSYLEVFGLSLKATQAVYKLKNDIPDSTENKIVFLAHKKNYFDPLNGAINTSLAFFSVTDKTTSNIFSISPAFYYLNNKQTLLFGGGFAHSSYRGRSNNKTNVNQYTLDFGFIPYFKQLWISSKRYYIVRQSQTNATSETSSTDEAYAIKLIWQVSAKTRLLPKKYFFGVLTGSRRYAVEQETLLIYNTGDKQLDSYFAAASWNAMDNTYLTITAGKENYQSAQDNNTRYYLNYITASLFKIW